VRTIAEIKLQFIKEKETSNTIRYAEVEDAAGNPPQVKTIYLQKFAAKSLGNPEKITVTIQVAGPEE
jgi:hypothetical protein